MKKLSFLNKFGLTIGGLVLTLSLAGCATNSSVKSSSSGSVITSSSSSVAADKNSNSKVSASSSSAIVTSASDVTSVPTTASSASSTSEYVAPAETTNSTEPTGGSSSTAEITTNENDIIANFAKAAGYYGVAQYSFMVTGHNGSVYTIEVRTNDGDSSVASLVGIFNYDATSDSYTTAY